MTNFLIIDSNKNFAEKLLAALDGGSLVEGKNFFNSAPFSKLDEEVVKINEKLNDETILLINAEGKTGLGLLQEQMLVDLAFWLRCKHKRENAIVFYSIQSVDRLLKQKPKNYILHAPGCYHFQLPFYAKDLERIKNCKALKPAEDIKPYIKAKIDLDLTRHRYANYAGMSLMLNVAFHVWNLNTKKLNEILKGFSSKEFLDFRLKTLDYTLMSAYFDLDRDIKLEDEFLKDKLKQQLSKRILLIDDFAEQGWKAIISQIIYGDHKDSRIKNLQLQYKKGDRTEFDLDLTEITLKNQIKTHKPHLVLLDLRLSDEEGKTDVKNLGGFKILKFIKREYKGLPVIMFTASSKAETTKQLLDAGADAVWTKPGIDEGLSNDEILERYERLFTLVKDVFEPDYSSLALLNDNPDEYFKVDEVDFDSIRNLLFRKLDFIKYRLRLYSDAEIRRLIPNHYSFVDAVYVDSNSLITGDDTRNYADLISSVLTLALLTSKSNCSFVFSRIRNPNFLPKVVIMNTVFDEIIKIAKKRKIRWDKERLYWDLSSKRSSISQLVIKELFDEEQVRTELFDRRESNLMSPKENPYADGYILDEIASLVVTHKSSKLRYRTNTKVICITGDMGLQAKLSCFNYEDDDISIIKTGNLALKTREEFIKDISSIKF